MTVTEHVEKPPSLLPASPHPREWRAGKATNRWRCVLHRAPLFVVSFMVEGGCMDIVAFTGLEAPRAPHVFFFFFFIFLGPLRGTS
jgi:hypothetical protein